MRKTILVGVTSSIATYKSVQLVSDLLKKGYNVEVIMSKNATEFVAPLTFSSLTKNKTYVDTFDREVDYNIEHISLAKKADLFVIAPATANVIAKVAHGISDDMLTTTFLASTCPKLIAPAMNTNMLQNPITQDNIKLCQNYGIDFIEPGSGLLACGDVGSGKLADIPTLIDAIEDTLHTSKTLKGKRVLISAGPTQEQIDPVRFISNHSSGKMGYALAKMAKRMGAEVTLVSGPTTLQRVTGVQQVDVITAQAMYDAMLEYYNNADIIIMAAAVADYTYPDVYKNKLKKDADTLELTFHKTKDILAYLGKHKKHQILCGFAMETEDLEVHAKEKFIKKNCDLLVANNLNEEGAGFQGNTNKVTLIKNDGNTSLELMSKEGVALKILEELATIKG